MKKSVDRYFDGYEKVKRTLENGKTKTQYIYKGSYYRIAGDEKVRRNVKLGAVIFTCVYALLYMSASFLHTIANVQSFVGVISLLELIPFVFLLGSVIETLTSGEYMISRKYSYGMARLKKMISVMFFFSLVILICDAGYVIIFHQRVSNAGIELLFVALTSARCFLAYIYDKSIKKLEIEEYPNSVIKNP